MIESILLEPADQFTPGSVIGLAAVVWDQDGDDLEYYWESQGGKVLGPFNPTATWELSLEAEPLSYESITLTVTDGRASVTRSKTIRITEGLMVEGYTYFQGTTIPVPGVEVVIGNFTTYSDDRGYYSIPHLKEGSAVLKGSKEGFDPFESEIEVDDARSTFYIYMTSPTESRQITGNIHTVDSLTYEGLKVSLLNPDFSESNLTAYTDLSGDFTISGVPVGHRVLMVSNTLSMSHFLNDTLVYAIDMNEGANRFDARIKIRRTVLSDRYLSESERWDLEGTMAGGFYLLGKGEHLTLKEFIKVPGDADQAMVYLNSFVIGGCDIMGGAPSHRLWVINGSGANMGGVSWGGNGNNFSADIEWYPSESPNFMDIYGREIKLRLEVYSENPCILKPQWRIYQIEFNYYY
ncbi:MAG: carboxypeptidase-like regulatory domain-containing protein [Bacteroidales bacterium]